MIILLEVIIGSIVGLSVIITCLSQAILFDFPGFSEYLPIMTEIFLIGAVINILMTALFSKVTFAIASPNSQYSVILVIIVEASIRLLHTYSTTAEILPTVFCIIVISTLLSGFSFFLIGFFQKGFLIRYVPYPVIAGICSAVGFILLKKTLSLQYQQGDIINIIQTLTVIALGVLAFSLNNYFKRASMILVLFVAMIFCFYIILFATHTSFSRAFDLGWLIKPAPKINILNSLTISSFNKINWTVVYSVFNLVLTLIATNIFLFLLSAISLEISIKTDIDLNKELRVSGIANIISGLLGGTTNSINYLQSTLANQLGGKTRIIGLSCGSFCLLVLIFGTFYLMYIPKFVLLGMLTYMSFTLIKQWLYDTFFTLNRLDYLILISIFLVTILFGIIDGFIVGIVLSLLIFAIDYSQINIVKYTLTGETLQSNKLRSPHAQLFLKKNGKKLLFFKLKGYIFFGSAFTLLQQINKKIKAASTIQFVILDFNLVNDLDSSAIHYLSRFKQLTEKYHLVLIFSSLNKKLIRKLKQENIISHTNSTIKVFSSADEALEWTEEAILQASSHKWDLPMTFIDQLDELFADIDKSINTMQLASYFETMILPPNQYIISQGSEPEGLYFIESGLVTVILQKPNHALIKLRKIGQGNIIGEIGVYNNSIRTASVITEQQCTLRYLSKVSLNTLEKEHPNIAIGFHRLIINMLAERIGFGNY